MILPCEVNGSMPVTQELKWAPRVQAELAKAILGLLSQHFSISKQQLPLPWL